MRCDLCSKEGQLFNTKIEGAYLDVCEACSKYGVIIDQVRTDSEVKGIEKAKRARMRNKPTQETVVPDYDTKIKRAREEKGLSQEEFAGAVSEKKSLIQNIESGRIVLSIELAEKLEKFLRIRLLELDDEEYKMPMSTTTENMTIGHLIKDKRKS